MNIETKTKAGSRDIATAVASAAASMRRLDIPFEPGELFRFELGRITIVDGRPVKSRDVNVYLDGERLKMVAAAVATARGFMLEFKVGRVGEFRPFPRELWDRLVDGQAHDIQVKVADPWTGEIFKEWEILDLEFWLQGSGWDRVMFNSKPKDLSW